MGSNTVNRINIHIKRAYYIYERFQINATFALLYHQEPLSITELSRYIRMSDHVIQLDEEHYFIIFAFTTHENAFKASQNIVHSLDHHFNNHTSCIVLDTFDPSKSPYTVLNRLKQILAETRKNAYIRTETESILDR